MRTRTLAILSAVAIATPLNAGDITKRSYSRTFEWESTDCYKPSAPYIYELDEYNKYEAESYVSEVGSYIDCVNNEASSDYRDAQRRLLSGIEDGRDQAVREATDELELFVSGL